MNETEFQKLKQDQQDSYNRLDQIKDVLDQAKDSTDLFDLLFKKRVWGDLTPKQAKNNFDLLDKLITLNDQFAMTKIERDWSQSNILSSVSPNGHSVAFRGYQPSIVLYQNHMDFYKINGIEPKIPFWGYTLSPDVGDLLTNHDKPIKVVLPLEVWISFNEFPDRLQLKYRGHYSSICPHKGDSQYEFYPFSIPYAKLQLSRDYYYIEGLKQNKQGWEDTYNDLQSKLGDWISIEMNYKNKEEGLAWVHKLRQIQKIGAQIYNQTFGYSKAKHAVKEMMSYLNASSVILASSPKLFVYDDPNLFSNNLIQDSRDLADQVIKLSVKKLIDGDIKGLFKQVFNQEVEIKYKVVQRNWKIVDFGSTGSWVSESDIF